MNRTVSKSLAALSLAAVFLAGTSAIASPPALEAPPAWSEVIKQRPLTIAVAGELPHKSHANVTFKNVEVGRAVKDTQAYWIPAQASKDFGSMAQVAQLKQELSAGKVIMFTGDWDTSHIWSLFGLKGSSMAEMNTSNFRTTGSYLWMDFEQKIHAGMVYAPVDASDDFIHEGLLEQTAYHLGHVNRNKPAEAQQSAFAELLGAKRVAAAGLDTGTFNNWVFAYDLEHTWNFTSGNKYTEMVFSHVLPTSVDTNTTSNFILFTIDGYMIPKVGTWWESDLLRYRWTGNTSNYGELHKYGPHAAPSATNVGINLAIGGSQDGISGEASFSYSWTVEDLDVIDNSDPSIERLQLTFDYDTSGSSDYSQQTTVQTAAWIIKLKESYSATPVCVSRRVDFYHPTFVDEYLDTSVCDTVPAHEGIDTDPDD